MTVDLLKSAPEEWEAIPGCGYEASTEGRIRNARTLRVLADEDHGGRKRYRKIELGQRPSRGGAGRRAYVHELVLEAFIGPRPVDDDGVAYQVHHRDDDPTNNALSNLEWLTGAENLAIRNAKGRPHPVAGWYGHAEEDPA